VKSTAIVEYTKYMGAVECFDYYCGNCVQRKILEIVTQNLLLACGSCCCQVSSCKRNAFQVNLVITSIIGNRWQCNSLLVQHVVEVVHQHSTRKNDWTGESTSSQHFTERRQRTIWFAAPSGVRMLWFTMSAAVQSSQNRAPFELFAPSSSLWVRSWLHPFKYLVIHCWMGCVRDSQSVSVSQNANYNF